MAMMDDVPTRFEDWYTDYETETRDGCLDFRNISDFASSLSRKYDYFKREMDKRVENYWKLERIADAEVVNPKPDLPNVSSGETAGMVRRMARNLVQHTPNVEVVSEFDDESPAGIYSKYILKSKIIGDDQYSNDMQQNLFASVKSSLTLGFDCVVPCLTQDAGGGWSIKYDHIHYRDVFPEPGVRDVRDAPAVFVRRYLTKGEAKQIVREQPAGWDIHAVKRMLKNNPPAREAQSVDHQTAKHHQTPDGYEIITWYTNSGEAFLTFEAREKMLLRIEKNKHPLKWHPVFFLVLENDLQQPLGKSQVELVMGRQEFQDLMLNGAMKQWWRNINPSLIGYGVSNGVPNLTPGKFTNISNPNARVEAFEVNSQTLRQYGTISQQNQANMIQLVGAADQQMAMQGSGGQMSQTPQGVEAQQAMVDITTNNYQKAIEGFFSRYCSYALTLYFAELKGIKNVRPTADTRKALVNAGIAPESFGEDGSLEIDYADLAIEYFVRTVPGSLVEMEDEKQMRILNELFVPLSQAMPAIAQSGDQTALNNATAAMQFIVQKEIELSGSNHSTELKALMQDGQTDVLTNMQARSAQIEQGIGEVMTGLDVELRQNQDVIKSLQEQISLLAQGQQAILQQLGVSTDSSTAQQPAVESATPAPATVA